MKQKDIEERFALIHARAREEAKMSQEKMAELIGVTRKTIAKWERGESCPTFLQSLKWFKALSINPMPRYCWITSNHNKEYKESATADEKLTDLIGMLDKDEKEKLIFILGGNHGSSPAPLLDLIVEYLHLPLMDRLIKATVVHESYKLSKEIGTTVNHDGAEPNMEALERALKEAQKAIQKHLNSYTYYMHNDQEES